MFLLETLSTLTHEWVTPGGGGGGGGSGGGGGGGRGGAVI
jgi:hypothetical protein